jgi:hypothetical protein
MRQREAIRLGRTRLELETELRDLTERLCSFSDHMKRAAEAHDMATVEDLAIEMHGMDNKIEEASFLLGLIYEAVK